MTLRPAVTVQALDKAYAARGGRIQALRDVSFAIGHGEFVSVVGPSGCGKSTILKILAGILRKSGGTIAVDGELLAGPSDKIGIVFQSPVLLPWRTVYDNVVLPVEVRRQPLGPARERARALIKLVGLAASRAATRPSCRAACSSASRSAGR